MNEQDYLRRVRDNLLELLHVIQLSRKRLWHVHLCAWEHEECSYT